MPAELRQFAPRDIDALRFVCLRTAAAGADASDLVTDPRLPGDVFAVPYGEFEPATSLVLDDGDGRVVGYVVAAGDTEAFEARCEADWWPRMRERYPVGSGTRPLDELFIGVVHDPPTAAPDVLASYPSHLHVNVLTEMQGGGWGRVLIEAICGLLVAEGSCGVHLGVDTANRAAQRFYERVGFERIETSADEVLFGRSLTADRCEPIRGRR